jgi:hypothetical protein
MSQSERVAAAVPSADNRPSAKIIKFRPRRTAAEALGAACREHTERLFIIPAAVLVLFHPSPCAPRFAAAVALSFAPLAAVQSGLNVLVAIRKTIGS